MGAVQPPVPALPHLERTDLGQRRTIWRLVGDYIDDEPLVGQGWEAFWYTPELHTDTLLQRGAPTLFRSCCSVSAWSGWCSGRSLS